MVLANHITAGFRGLCLNCRRSPQTCYCKQISRFDPKIRFVILIHKREAQKRMATGRMSYLSLKNSQLIEGFDNYQNDPQVNDILENPNFYPVVLYPGSGATNLSKLSLTERSRLFPEHKELVVFVIDGTWITARKALQRSQNLARLPQISFEPNGPSRFRVRLQPKPNYISTLEAIHQTIELLGPIRGFDKDSRLQDGLLKAFDHMVEQQIELTRLHSKY